MVSLGIPWSSHPQWTLLHSGINSILFQLNYRTHPISLWWSFWTFRRSNSGCDTLERPLTARTLTSTTEEGMKTQDCIAGTSMRCFTAPEARSERAFVSSRCLRDVHGLQGKGSGSEWWRILVQLVWVSSNIQPWVSGCLCKTVSCPPWGNFRHSQEWWCLASMATLLYVACNPQWSVHIRSAINDAKVINKEPVARTETTNSVWSLRFLRSGPFRKSSV